MMVSLCDIIISPLGLISKNVLSFKILCFRAFLSLTKYKSGVQISSMTPESTFVFDAMVPLVKFPYAKRLSVQTLI